MNKKEILVTGGAGFIGSHLVDKLLDEGSWRVTVVDNFDDAYSPAVKRANIALHLQNKDYQLFELDICDHEALKKSLGSIHFDAVIHLAARAGVRLSLRNPHLYQATNITGTLNLLELARAKEIKKFIFGSSSSVYGTNAKVPFGEDDPTQQPISPYAATKAAAELLCHTYSRLYGIQCLILRFFTAYGARQRPDLAIHKFARAILSGKPITLYGDGASERDYTYVDDIVSGVRAALDFDSSNFEIINLGESRAVSLSRLVELLEKELGRKAIIERLPEQPGDMTRSLADISKAQNLLGYKPETPIEDGIKKFVEWFISNAQG